MAHSTLGQVLQRARFLAPGDKLGKHDLIRQIAVGGMAELYLARTVGIEGFEKLVVVKRILPQYADNSSFVNMFLNEARLAATLHHPNIAQVYDIGQEQGEYFFSMEYVHGEDLGHLVASASEHGVPISLDGALTFAVGLCAGLHHAHEKASPDGKPLNVVHRDVSPSNVLVSYDGGVKLVDFGIARVNSTPTSTHGGLKGKIAYMSPEQCRGKAVLDRRSDIFSVGTILYELTTGQLPFTDETEYGILNQIVNRDADPPSKLVPSYPAALEAIVMRALARDPDQRFATALELQGQLEDFAHENRLRVSPLVLARLMSSLFPARLEEWDSARAQGAFFVEQHVVRTLIESGKSGESVVVPQNAGADNDDTAVTQAPVAPEDAPTSIRSDLVGAQFGRAPLPGLPLHAPAKLPEARAATPRPIELTPPALPRAPTPPISARTPTPQIVQAPTGTVPGVFAVAPMRGLDEPLTGYQPPVRIPTPVPRVASPVPGMPQAMPIYIPLPAPQPGTLVSSSMNMPVVNHHIGDVTERVRVPEALLASRKKKPLIALAFALGGALCAASITYFVLSRGDSPDVPTPTKVSEPTPKLEPVPEAPPVVLKAEPKPAPKPAPEPVIEAKPPAPDPIEIVEPIKPEPKAEPPPAVKAVPKPEPRAVVRAEPKPKPRPPIKKPKADVKKPEVKKPEPKEPQWNGDSPFMPVRPDKK